MLNITYRRAFAEPWLSLHRTMAYLLLVGFVGAAGTTLFMASPSRQAENKKEIERAIPDVLNTEKPALDHKIPPLIEQRKKDDQDYVAKTFGVGPAQKFFEASKIVSEKATAMIVAIPKNNPSQIRVIDLNGAIKSGRLSLDEAEKFAIAKFDNMDADKDGTLDPKETKNLQPTSAYKQADPDRDGTIDKALYIEAVQLAFQKADKKHTGILDEEDLKSPAGKSLLKLIK